MDRELLYAQYDGVDVDGYFYALGNTLADDVSDETRERLIAEGSFSTTDPYAFPRA